MGAPLGARRYDGETWASSRDEGLEALASPRGERGQNGSESWGPTPVPNGRGSVNGWAESGASRQSPAPYQPVSPPAYNQSSDHNQQPQPVPQPSYQQPQPVPQPETLVVPQPATVPIPPEALLPPETQRQVSGGAPVSGPPLGGAPVSGAPVSGVPISGAPVSGLPVSGVPI
ncbi:MAG: hypothetical protein HKP61_07960, partial [Dactylosporangium sp.]|nr:hypothetical protein [Dactylosporangium sp.]NNJ60871.1 hypothetical protein [Dactylosporangium sp.]